MAVAGIIGAAISTAGSFISSAAQGKMVAEQTRASKVAENSREQQMRLDAAHRRRQSVREGILARAQGLTVGTAQGAGQGSGVAAATGIAVGQGLENQQVASATERIGGRIFSANREYFEATQRGQRGMAVGQGMQAIGGALTQNAGTIHRIGTYFGKRPEGSTLNRNV